MGWLTTLRRNHAAKRYALKLPALLAHNWGESEFYTPNQIRGVVSKLKLNKRFIEIAYAAYLPKDQYEHLARETLLDMTYDNARAFFFQYWSPSNAFARWDPIGPSQGVMDYNANNPR